MNAGWIDEAIVDGEDWPLGLQKHARNTGGRPRDLLEDGLQRRRILGLIEMHPFSGGQPELESVVSHIPDLFNRDSKQEIPDLPTAHHSNVHSTQVSELFKQSSAVLG
jgi:hypothetical protein